MALADNSLFVVQHNGSPHSLTFSNLKTYQEDYFLPLSGGDMSGNLLVLYPTDDDHAASKEYVDLEIVKIQSQLDDLGTNLGNGRYQFSLPGFLSFPRSGDFVFVAFNSPTGDPTSTTKIQISTTNKDGETQTLDDVAPGTYLQFKVAGSSNEAVFTVTSVITTNDPSYNEFGVTLHSATSGYNFVDGQISYLNTLHIDGIDLNDLEQTLDGRYLQLTSLTEQNLTGDVNFNNNLKVGGDKVVIDNNGNAEFENVVTALEYEGDGAKLTGIVRSYTGTSAPSNPEEGDIWFKENSALYAPPGALHVYKNSMWMAAATPYDLAGLDALP